MESPRSPSTYGNETVNSMNFNYAHRIQHDDLDRSHSLSNIRRSSGIRRQSIPILHSGAIFRNGILQLMSHGLDPLEEGVAEDDGFIFSLSIF